MIVSVRCPSFPATTNPDILRCPRRPGVSYAKAVWAFRLGSMNGVKNMKELATQIE